MKLYRVLGWDDHFENSKSRERKDCSFVCIPNGQSGLGFSRIMARKDGAAIYGIWCLLLGALSRQSRVDKIGRDGWLTQDGHPTGTPWTAEDLALLWRRPESEIANALTVFESPAIAWIKSEEVIEIEQQAINARQLPANCPIGIVKEGSEEKEKKEGAAIAVFPFLDDPSAKKAWEDWKTHLKEKKIKTTSKATEVQIEKCAAWGLTRTIAALKHSTANNYQGLFEPNSNGLIKTPIINRPQPHPASDTVPLAETLPWNKKP